MLKVNASRAQRPPRTSLLTTLLVILFVTLSSGAELAAQNYRFAVPSMDLEVFVEPDASARLAYKIKFHNMPGAHAIDIVDVGLPHADYNLGSMAASIDGQPLHSIHKSEYIDVGVEVPLGGRAIPGGQTGTFAFTCRMPDMVYRDTTDKQMASLQIRPTWFDPQSEVGTTQLRIAVHLPPGVEPNEVKYHSEQWKYDDLVWTGEGKTRHVVARWLFDSLRLSDQNPKVGISFPGRVMQRTVNIGPFGLLVRWFSERPGPQFISAAMLLTGLAFLFFRFSGGTGCVVFVILAGLLVVMMLKSPAAHLAAWPVMIVLIVVNEWFRSRRGKRYLPAMATIEGGGIKRGLTAPQAAVILELPLAKVLTLVVFGLLKKGALKMTKDKPLAVEVAAPFRVARKRRRKVAAEQGLVLHEYEHAFLDLLLPGDKPVEAIDFSAPLGQMIKATAGLMKGFDRQETQEYYRRIVSRAWIEAAKIGELKQRSAAIDRNLEWLLMDSDAEGRFGRWHSGGYHYWPTWYGVGRAGGSASSPVPSTSAAPTSQTSLSEVASSFAGWTENTSGRLASAIDPGSLGFDLPSSGLLDLSGVDRVTSDVFEGLSQGGGGGGGGGGCACACAGCACACACAGGGR